MRMLQFTRIVLLSAIVGAMGFAASAKLYQESVVGNFLGPVKGAGPISSLLSDASGNLYGTAPEGGPANAGTVFKLDPSGHLKVVYSFAGAPDGSQPNSGLISDASGNLYGTTYFGGDFGNGTVFKIDAQGRETILHTFAQSNDGMNPQGKLLLDAQGNLYGTTRFGGSMFGGILFKLDPTGTETILYNFNLVTSGGNPAAGVIMDSAGNFYGTASGGGKGFSGVVFKVDPSGNQTTLHTFKGAADGGYPLSDLLMDAQGNLYGTAVSGGKGYGVVFKVSPAGKETVLYAFAGPPDGMSPESGLAMDADGNLYGTTSAGGTAFAGTVYRVDKAGRERVLYNFTNAADGGRPYGAPILDSSGNVYGTASTGGAGYTGFGVAYKVSKSGQETVLYTFPGNPRGTFPSRGVVLGGVELYGVTNAGGKSNYGTVFQMSRTGQEKVLHQFTGGSDGALPNSVILSGGNLIGTTQCGGAGTGYACPGAGVVFQVTPAGDETILHTFSGGADGGNPFGLIAHGGNFYGTTAYGGANNAGVVFKMDPAGNVTILYSFTGGADGANPNSNVAFDAAGNLYGSTACGGTGSTAPCSSGAGVLYKIDPAGNESTLYAFTGGADGAIPTGDLVLDSKGNIYGTTPYGGSTELFSNGAGVVYRVTSGGSQSVLYTFSGAADGAVPGFGVIRDAKGNLFGTTTNGGSNGSGVAFELSADGHFNLLYDFLPAGGYNPTSGLVPDGARGFYGTAGFGGVGTGGTVYRISRVR